MNHHLSPAAVAGTTSRSRRFRVGRAGAVAAMALTLGLGAAACSKSDEVSTSQSTTVAPATSKPADAAGAGTGSTLGTSVGSTPSTLRATTSTGQENTTTSTTSAANTTTTTGGSPSTTGTTVAGTPADAAFCAKGFEIESKMKNFDPKDPNALAQYKQVFADLAAAAPPEMQADMQEINSIIQSMTDVNSQPANADKLEAAGQRVDTWAVAHCGKKFG